MLISLGLLLAGCPTVPADTPAERDHFEFESVTLKTGGPPATMQLMYRVMSAGPRHPVILMLGSLKPNEPPAWSRDLLRDGYMLAAFMVTHPLDQDPARRAQWLVFDERFAHSYVLGGIRTIADASRMIDYLVSRKDVNPDKIGWLGSSSTAILGIAAATRERRLRAFVGFVSTGALRAWFKTWEPNGLTKGQPLRLWPETEKLLDDEPIKHVATLYPMAVLLVNGGEDKVVDVRSARAFAEAARPFYRADPDRFRLVVYEGMQHNLPADVVKLHAEHWFRLYLHPTLSPPSPTAPIKGIRDSAGHTSINGADHRKVTGSEDTAIDKKG
jgi:dienelactone hydrolase